ncbi:MAG: hypothetical protein GC192_22715 [Bacteroidetes bacterium]|nr:hypothetical protein [Bacteroidota bacterium]
MSTGGFGSYFGGHCGENIKSAFNTVMKFELKLLAKPLEADFSYYDRGLPTFIFLIFGIIGIFILPFFDLAGSAIIKIILVVIGIFLILQKVEFKKENEIITPNIVGTLSFDGITILFKTPENMIVVNKDFQGTIQFKFGGYKGEIEGYGRNSNVYYGTNNIRVALT